MKKKYKLNKIAIQQIGIYRLGLIDAEIKEYLALRTGETDERELNKLLQTFWKIAGVNTMAVVNCPECKKEQVLMYRHDVERFANKLLLGIETYFD